MNSCHFEVPFQISNVVSLSIDSSLHHNIPCHIDPLFGSLTIVLSYSCVHSCINSPLHVARKYNDLEVTFWYHSLDFVVIVSKVTVWHW